MKPRSGRKGSGLPTSSRIERTGRSITFRRIQQSDVCKGPFASEIAGIGRLRMSRVLGARTYVNSAVGVQLLQVRSVGLEPTLFCERVFQTLASPSLATHPSSECVILTSEVS